MYLQMYLYTYYVLLPFHYPIFFLISTGIDLSAPIPSMLNTLSTKEIVTFVDSSDCFHATKASLSSAVKRASSFRSLPTHISRMLPMIGLEASVGLDFELKHVI